MKKLFTLFLATAIGSISYGQCLVSATYSGTTIGSNYGSYSAACNLDDTLVVNVPSGANVTSVEVIYSMTAASGAWMSEQRSRIECITTGNTEASFYAGSGTSGGTYNYNRTGLTIANGTASGPLTFRMQNYRTWGGSGCVTNYQSIVSGGWTVIVYFDAPPAPFTPIISQDTILGDCGDMGATVSANSNYAGFAWSTGDSTSSITVEESGVVTMYAISSVGCLYGDTVVVSVIAPNMQPEDTSICEGETVELDAYYVPSEGCIDMTSFDESNSMVVDHNSYSGDDRGGIAITNEYLYYVGDNNTVRMKAEDLSEQTSLGQRDGIFSDLDNGQLYTLWSVSGGGFGNSSTYYDNIDAIRMMDEDLNYGDIINLSQSISAGYYSFIGAGAGFVILWANNNDTFYHIDLATGDVTTLGTGNIYTTANPGVYYQNAENWAKWGIAECDSAGGFTVVGRAYYWNGSYVYSPGRIVRYYISSGATELVTQLSGSPSDMACITYSPWNDRWYFHYEGSGLFGGGSETAGFADAEGYGGGGFVPGYDFTWSTGDSTRSIMVTPSTTTQYTVSVSDGIQECLDTADVSVTDAPDISFNITNIACKGDTTGAVGSSLNGGTSPFAYQWWPMDTNIANGFGTGTSINTLPSGTYYLMVTDDNGCGDLDTAVVTEPSTVLSPILSGIIDPLCSYSDDGRVAVLVAGGDGPYSFDWSDGAPDNDTNNTMVDGPYSVTVTDANGCERVLSGTLDAPDAVVHGLTATGNTCENDEDGEAFSNVSGGTPPYSYLWEDGATSTSTNNLPSGYATLQITDNHNCVFLDSILIGYDFDSPVVTLEDQYEKCQGWSLTLDAGPNGVSYEWSTGDTTQTITTSAGGLFLVTVTGPNGCVTEASTYIQDNPCPTGIEDELGKFGSLTVYPNPSNGMVTLELSGNLSENLDVEILDITGRVIYTKPAALNASQTMTTMDLSSIAKGSYILRLLHDGESVSVNNIVLQ